MAKATMAATATAGVIDSAAVANDGVTLKRACFRVAGYLFTYRKGTGATKVRIDMWREDPSSRERYWITVAACAPNRASARSVALALTAWVKSCDIGPKRDVQSQAVAESFAMLRQHLAFTNPGASGSVRGRRIAAPGVSPVDAAAVTQGKRAANESGGVTRRGAVGGTRVAAA